MMMRTALNWLGNGRAFECSNKRVGLLYLLCDNQMLRKLPLRVWVIESEAKTMYADSVEANGSQLP